MVSNQIRGVPTTRLDEEAEPLQRRLRVLQAIIDAQHAYIDHDSTSELFDDMLTALLEVTESEYGSIAEVLYAESGTPHFGLHALAETWNDDTQRRYDESQAAGLEVLDVYSLSDAIFETGEAAIANCPWYESRGAEPAPQGPMLHSFLGAPFSHGGTMIGVVFLSNRPQGYDERLLEDIEPFLTTCAGIIESHRAERRRLEHELRLREAKEAAEAANRAKSAFLTSVTHELRTPLTAIIGFAKSLLKNSKGNLDARQLELLGRISDRSVHLCGLIENVLTLQSSQRDESKIELSTVDAVKLVRSVVQEVSAARGRAGIELVEELPAIPALLTTDIKRIRRILATLLDNAFRFIEAGTITVRLGVSANAQARYVEVEDTGIGIPENMQDMIFLPFRQVDEGTNRKFDGTGLGLAVSKWLTEQLGYRLTVRSAVGEGSTFRVDFSS